MAIVAGIDEAGYGPVLGPLVVSSVVLELPETLLDADLWQVLGSSVCRRPQRGDTRLAIADSKALFQGRHRRLAHLERAVLAALWCRGSAPAELGQLLSVLAPGLGTAMAAYPWYRDAALPLPTDLEGDAVITGGTMLLQDLQRHGLQLRSISSEVVLAGELNELLAATGSKAQALFDINGRHLLRLLELAGDGGQVVVHLDRHGARKRYRGLLHELAVTADDQAWVWVRHEDRETSAYTIETAAGRVDLLFTVGCEQRQLPVALASMTCKYVRELLMELLNRFWTSQVPGLRPTAGYPVDGRRFLDEIGPACQELQVDQRLLRRRR